MYGRQGIAQTLHVHSRRSAKRGERGIVRRKHEIRDIRCWNSSIPSTVIRRFGHVYRVLAVHYVPRKARRGRVFLKIQRWSQSEEEGLLFTLRVQETGSPSRAIPAHGVCDDDSSVRNRIGVRRVCVVIHFMNLEVRSVRRFVLPRRYPSTDSRVKPIGPRIGYNHKRIRHLASYPHPNPAVRDRSRHVEVNVAIRHSIEREDILRYAVHLEVEIGRFGVIVDAIVSLRPGGPEEENQRRHTTHFSHQIQDARALCGRNAGLRRSLAAQHGC